MKRKKNKPYNPNAPYIVNCHCKVCKKVWVVGERVNYTMIEAIKRAFKRHKNCIESGIRYSYERKVI